MSRLNSKSKFLTLQYFEIGYEFRFDPIKAFLKKTEGMIHKQEEELTKKFQKWNQEHDGDPETPDAYDVYEMEILNSSQFGNLLNQSMYLTIYSTFENEFFNLCEWCKNAENLSLGPKDINDRSYIGQCRKYIIKAFNVNLDKLNSQWNEIKNYQVIRNSIAHNDAILNEGNQAIQEFIEKTEGISIDKKEMKIKIHSIVFLTNLIDKIVAFLTETINEIINQKDTAFT